MREKITSSVFIILLLVFFVFSIILPSDPNASKTENRPLASMPDFTWEDLITGQFASGYESYITDNIALRSHLVTFGTNIDKLCGINNPDSPKVVSPASSSPLLLKDGKIMEIYRENPTSLNRYIRILNRYAIEYSERVNLYSMLIPTQIEFDKSEYSVLSDSEKKSIDTVYSGLKRYKTIDVYNNLKKHLDEYIYFRTDHHWTQQGGYYGYSALMKEKGEKPIEFEDIKFGKYKNFLGYLYNQANVSEYSKYADDIEYFKNIDNHLVCIMGQENGQPFSYMSNIYDIPPSGAKTTYDFFMGGNHPYSEIYTNLENDQVALVIKDSYANTVVPFLTNHYQKIIVVDPRSFHGSVKEIIDEHTVDDIIFINYVLSTSFPDFVERIYAIK